MLQLTIMYFDVTCREHFPQLLTYFTWVSKSDLLTLFRA